MERWVQITEKAAGLFLAAIAVITFASVLLRGTIGYAIPDGFDISRLMLAVTIFWGIACTGYRNEHIQVDLLWQVLPARGRRWLDILATGISLAAMLVFAWMLATKVASTIRSGEATFDLRLAVWPFHLLAAVGIAFAVVLLAIRLVRLARIQDGT